MDNFRPEEEYLIRDLDTLRLAADPIKNQIYEALIDQPANIKQVAGRLGLAASRLYYHFNQMEKAGLIKVVETRMVSNMVEKVYRAAAYNLNIDPTLFSFKHDQEKESLTGYLAGSIDATREDLVRSLQARFLDLDQGAEPRPRSVMVSRTLSRIPDSQAEAFNARFHALVDEFTSLDSPAAEDGEPNQQYALLVAFYPSFYFKEDEGDSPPG